MRSVTMATVLALAAACGNTGPDEGGSNADVLTSLAKSVVPVRASRDAGSTPAAARSPEQAAAEALRVNPGPLIQAGFEGLGRSQIMAMTGQNGAIRTYMTPAEEALILRDGMLVGTRGLGRDLSVAEPGTDRLIRAVQAGSGSRVMRYLSGDGLERPLQFACTTAPGPNPGVIVESCEGHGTTFQNNYLVQGGQIPVSRQWIGPGLGYVTIQTLRP
ncbi:YjbF family lipoprotein [Paracoccus hibiscisoli]|uniref:YjbF family lipoprotein n=1 Tax=Paracoccus hibiscisoli TaxID=2023261 RepID=A0A4U0QLZ6_9RHOB|nr:YjbF family lipoprotein [Paracoccus hibiscisoli]TJZ82755.1 YjbF family lipoprotein [Paracoccus hibiscisoli]